MKLMMKFYLCSTLKKCFWCYFRQLFIFSLKKMQKDSNMLKFFLLQSFCPLKTEIADFIFGFRLNPWTPVPAITGRDEPRPFFHFWRHPFCPKLASSILNFCRMKTSFQWCPDQGDWPNGARDMHKNAQKVEWKTPSKIPCQYPWLLHRKNCPSRCRRFLRNF